MKPDLRDGFLIREYRNTDYEGITKVWESTGLGNPERRDDRTTIDRTIKLGGCLLVAEEKGTGTIVGTSWITNDGRRLFLHHFGILPEFQGRGLSDSLMKESLGFVKMKGLQVKLEVHSSNHKAINLYKKFGFRYLSDYNVFIIRDLSAL
jgi:ribosomal protein S18 acetylase RimI-like enzyme